VATKASSVARSFTEAQARRPRLVGLLGWVTTREDRCEPGSVRRCGLKSVTNRLESRHRADNESKQCGSNNIT